VCKLRCDYAKTYVWYPVAAVQQVAAPPCRGFFTASVAATVATTVVPCIHVVRNSRSYRYRAICVLLTGAESVFQWRSAAVRRSVHATESYFRSAIRRRCHGVRDHADRCLGVNWIRYPVADATGSGRRLGVLHHLPSCWTYRPYRVSVSSLLSAWWSAQTSVNLLCAECIECFCLPEVLGPNSTTRTPATDMLYNTTNGRAHNNSTTNLPNRKSQCQSPTSRRVKMLGCGKFLSVGGEFICTTSCRNVVSSSVGGVRLLRWWCS